MKKIYRKPFIYIIKIAGNNALLQSSTTTMGVNWNDDEVDGQYAD